MQKLRNWDNKTWLSSKKYILNFNKFLKSKVNLNKNSKILDIGCGRANIISALQNKYKFKIKPTGIDIIKNKNLKKNIVSKKIDGIRYFKNEGKIILPGKANINIENEYTIKGSDIVYTLFQGNFF